MSDVGFNIPVTFDVDEGAARAASAQAGRQFVAGMEGAADTIGRDFRDSFRDIGRASGNAFKTMNAGFKQFESNVKGASSRINSDLASAFNRAGREIDELNRDAKALAATIQAQKDRKFGIVDEKEFALLNRSLEKLQQFQRTVGKTNFNDPGAVRQIRQQFAALQQEATKAKALFQTSTKDQVADAQIAARRISQVEAQAARERLVEQSKAASQAKFIAQREQQEILSATQRSNAQRIQLTRFALETLGRLEKGFGATVAGIARTASRTLGRGYQDTLGRVSSSFSRNSSRIQQIERSSATSRVSIFRSAQRQQERILQQSISRQATIIQGAQAKANAGLIGAARRSPGLGTLGGGLAGFGVLSLGLERFSNLERLTKQFTALTGSAEDAAIVLEQVKEFARATPFDLVGVADLAKGFLAIKTPIDQVLPRVRAIADAVALTGGGVDELNRIQRAIGQVVSAGRLQGDELNQLAENLPGLNIRQILADQLTGGNVQALVKLQEAGKISGDAFVDGLITGLANDLRLQGASEDLAKTLGGRLANLKEVVADVGAAFIGLIADPMKEATRIATVALDGLSSFIKGEISPAMQVLRTAIGGAAAAIGALIAAKVAGEALQVLASAARLVLTPFGAIVAAVGLAGAAFAVIRDRSEEFREVTDRLGRLLGTTFGRVMDSVGDAVQKVRDAFASARAPITGTADAIERSLQPARTFISEVGTKLGDAIATAGRFLTDTLIPAIADFVIFIGKNAGPALRSFRDILADLGGKVADRVREGFEKLKPVLSSVNDILGEVVDKVKGIASGAGSLTALIPTGAAILGGGLVAGPIGALVAGLATGIATLSPTIRKSIVDGVKGARDEVVKVFNNIDWPGLADSALGFVQRLGFIVGNIVTDARFVAALAGIAAVAVAVAFKFVVGFVQGVISNLGELVDLGSKIGNALLEGIRNYVTDNPLDAALILGGVLLAKNAVTIGRSVAAGLTEGLGSFKGNVRGGGDFLSTALFGPGGATNFAREAGKTAKAAAEEARRQLSTVSRAAGGGGVSGLVGGFSQADIADAKRQFQGLTSEVGKAGAAGLRLRTAFADTFASIRTNSSGIKGIFSSITTGVGDARAALKGQGAALGSALGVGVAAGFASALGGQQLGQGNTAIGLGGILVSSLGAGFAVGGPVGGIVGGAVGAVGLLTAAFTANSQAAKKAKEEIAFYRDILVDIAGTGEDAAAAIRDGFGEQLRKELPETIRTFADLGITTEDFLDIVSLAPKDFAAFKAGMDEIGTSTKTVDSATGDAVSRIDDIRAALAKLPAGTARDTITAIVDAFASGTITADQYRNALDFINDETGEFVAGSGSAADLLKVLGEDAKTAATEVDGLADAVNFLDFGPAVARVQTGFAYIGELIGTIEANAVDAKVAVNELLNPTEGTLASEVGKAIGSLSGVASDLGAGFDLGGLVGGAQAAGALEGLRSKISTVVQQGLEDGASEAQIDDNLRVINAAISELDVPQEVKDAMQAELQAAIDADIIEVDIQAIADEESAKLAGGALSDAAKRAVDADALRGAGTQVGAGFASGIRSALDRVRAAVKALTDAATLAANVNLDISSPSKVFMEIGEETAAGFSLGIINSLGFVEAAGTQMGNTFTDATVEAVAQLNDRIAGLRLDLFGSILGGAAGPDAALRGGQNAIRSLTDALAGPIQEAAEAGRAASRGIDFGEGLVNRDAFADVVEQIKSVGEGLLQAGFTPAQITAELTKLRQQALDVAGFLGFDTAAIDSFFASLGLSASSLETFASQLLTETERLKKEAEEDEATRRKEEADRTAEETAVEQPIEQTVNVNLALPFADPEAVALAVANRTAALVRRR